MKKILAFTTILLFGFILIACGKKTVTVKFNLDYEGAAKIEDKVINKGEKVTLPSPNPVRDGYTFEYWTLEGARFNHATAIDKNIELVAKWRQNEVDDKVTISVNKPTLDIQIGKTEQITVTTNDKEGFNVESSDKAIATVSETGLVTAIAEGTAIITVTAKTDETVTAKVTVTVFPEHTGAPTTIKIMHGNTAEVDPFHPDYSGQNQKERQDLQRAVETKNNVRVQYVMYPTDAGWGPARVDKIIETYDSNAPMADIYWATSDWTGTLANAKAIKPIPADWFDELAPNIGQPTKEIGAYKGQLYGFIPSDPGAQLGLYFNEDLLDKYGLKNPIEYYQEGTWTWSTFESWASNAQAQLSKVEDQEEYAVGGAVQLWVQSLVPLNGGRMINMTTQQIAFNQTEALETYSYLKKLWDSKLMEPAGTYDAGSPEWQAGRVLTHPGSFWFLNSDNRWGGLKFKIGFVPFPMSDAYVAKGGKYITPASGEAVYNLANGTSDERSKLAFKIWNEIQLWKTPEEGEREFTAILRQRLGNMDYVNAFLDISSSVYLDLIDALGISAYGADGFRAVIGAAIKTGDPRAAVEGIRPTYQAALNSYFGK